MFETSAAHPYPTYSNPLALDPDRGFPETVAVIGAGTIGPDIAYFFKHTHPETDLVLVDIVEDALESAEGHIEGLVEKGIRYDQIDEGTRERILDIEYTTDYDAIAGSDLVIEAVTENLDLKRDVVSQIETAVDDDCIVASNTSSIPAERVFAEATYPARTTVTHFFAPAWRNPVVEIVNWDEFRRVDLEYLYWLFGALGKLPLVVEDEIAFMLDRVFNNWCNESGKLLDRATAAAIDATAEEFVAAGPFGVLNLSNGNPIIVEANGYLAEENDAYEPAHIFRSVEEWDTIDPGADVEVPPDVEALARDRLLGVLFSQATDVVDRNIGTRADLNVGCEAALGFTEGPFDAMAEADHDEIERILGTYTDERPGVPTPDREPSAYLDFYRHLVVDEIDGVAVVTIRRPHRGNILSTDVFDEIERVLRERADDPDVEGFVLTGYGPDAFSSGWEIDSFRDVLGEYDRSYEYARECSELFAFIEGMETPIVAALNGHVLGAGLELVVRCHGIVAVEGTHLQFPEATLGILPGIGGAVVPYRRWEEVPDATFSNMLRFGERLSTDEAAELGVIDRLVSDHTSLVEAAVDRAKAFEGSVDPIREQLDGPADVTAPEPQPDPVSTDNQPLSPEVDELVCETIAEAAVEPTLDDALEVGYEAFAEAACTDAAREGVTAFVEGREPDLRGNAGADGS